MSAEQADRESIHSSDSSFDERDDQDWADWVGDEEEEGAEGAMHYGGQPSSSFRLPTRGLFSKETYDSPMEALARAKQDSECDLVAVVKRLGESWTSIYAHS